MHTPLLYLTLLLLRGNQHTATNTDGHVKVWDLSLHHTISGDILSNTQQASGWLEVLISQFETEISGKDSMLSHYQAECSKKQKMVVCFSVYVLCQRILL